MFTNLHPLYPAPKHLKHPRRSSNNAWAQSSLTAHGVGSGFWRLRVPDNG